MSKKYRTQFVDPLGGIAYDAVGNRIQAALAGAPTNSIAGYLPGAIYQDLTNAIAYINAGTVTSSAFVALQSSTTGTFTTLVTNAWNAAAAATTITVKANTAAALTITDATTSMYVVDTRNTVTGVIQHKFAASPPTIAGAAGTTFSMIGTTAFTLTDSTTTGVTALDGLMLNLAAPTIAQTGGAVTVTTASSLYISKVVAGSSVTITNNYLVNTNQSGCFCTAAGVWTDTASTRRIKKAIEDATPEAIKAILNKLRPRTWKYDETQVGDDFDRQRYGIVSEELPDCFRIPGITDDQGGLNGSILGSFALAALRFLWDRNQDLEARLAQLESA